MYQQIGVPDSILFGLNVMVWVGLSCGGIFSLLSFLEEKVSVFFEIFLRKSFKIDRKMLMLYIEKVL